MRSNLLKAAMAAIVIAVAGGTTAEAGLIAYYSLGEGSGTTAVDSVGGQNGTLVGGTTYTNAGRNGTTAVQLSAWGIDLPSSVLSQAQATQEVSFTAWINPTAFYSYQTIFDTTSRQFAFWLTASGGWAGMDGFGGSLTFTSPATLNQWQFLAVSYKAGSGGSYNVYLDGALVASRAATQAATFNNSIKLGANVSGGGVPFEGMMQEVSIYNHALSASEVGAATPEPGTITLLAASLSFLGAALVARRRAAANRA